MNFNTIALEVLVWYRQNKRMLPWRQTSNPYFIWLSEIIMQQTRVAQGTGYYLRFIEAFPTIQHLAAAELNEVLKLWEGLGYYSRARNMHKAANQVVNAFDGQLPKTFAELTKISGIGTYTAAAIASICFGEKQPVIDGNVYRVLSRLFSIYTPINSHQAKAEFFSIGKNLIHTTDNPGDFNQGMMELGALVCLPKKPKCNHCPLQTCCKAYVDGTTELLPVKIPKKKSKTRFLNYLLYQKNEQINIEQRLEKDIWKGLFQFPLVESVTQISDADELKQLIKSAENWSKVHFTTHQLSHQTLRITFWTTSGESAHGKRILIEDLKHYAFPVPLKRFIYIKLLPLPALRTK